MKKIDVFPHILPRPFLDQVERIVPKLPPTLQEPLQTRSCLYDLDRRFKVMDEFEGYQQVLTLSVPPIESLVEPPQARELARIANDSMADLVSRYPDRFVGFAASLPLNDIDASLEEIERAVGQLGALGIQIFTNINGLPLDEPRFDPLFARMSALDRAIWVHPYRTAALPDYLSESSSKYGLFMAFGWPYETAAFMSRLICSGVMDRYPNLKIITHHCGGILPHFAQRIGTAITELPPVAGPGEDPPKDLRTFKMRVIERYKRFYGDTALSGIKAPLQSSLTFFSADHVMFGTDMPFDPENGPGWIRAAIEHLESMEMDPADRQKIFEGNARRVLKL